MRSGTGASAPGSPSSAVASRFSLHPQNRLIALRAIWAAALELEFRLGCQPLNGDRDQATFNAVVTGGSSPQCLLISVVYAAPDRFFHVGPSDEGASIQLVWLQPAVGRQVRRYPGKSGKDVKNN